IENAIYNGNYYRPISVSESATTPTWVLTDGSNTVNVVGADIDGMQLVVHLEDETSVKYYTLQFDGYMPDKIAVTIHKVNLTWKVYGGPDGFTQYCNRADGSQDLVVFQQEIVVNAVTANVVKRDDAFVTLSCRYGAPATVRLWGYTYRVGNTDLFDAAM